MAFFSHYGTVWYNMKGLDSPILLNNITKAIALDRRFKVDPRLVLNYNIRDNDRPELLSHRLYGTVDYWWTVLLVNNIFNYEEQWPLNDEQLESYIKAKYPHNNPTDIHHWETIDGFITDPMAIQMKYNLNSEAEAIVRESLVKVTIQDYEEKINEEKREIILVDPDYINTVVQQMVDFFKT